MSTASNPTKDDTKPAQTGATPTPATPPKPPAAAPATPVAAATAAAAPKPTAAPATPVQLAAPKPAAATPVTPVAAAAVVPKPTAAPAAPVQPAAPKPAAAAPATPIAPAATAPKPAPAPAAAAPTPPKPAVRPPVSEARFEWRHRIILLSFIGAVLLPLTLIGGYLALVAKDQYASYLGFSVRSESASQPLEMLGGIVGLSKSSTSDTDVLYKFLTSRELVQRLDDRLDLRAIWSRVQGDPLFTYHGDHNVEDLLKHWQRKINVYYDSGMIDIRVLAFDPADAQAIAQAIFEESSSMINNLNAISRDDAIRYSREELAKAVDRLKTARQAITEFRDKHQLVDPAADVQGQLGILTSLQQQLAEALINRGMLMSNARDNDPRVQQSDLRIKVIEDQIEQERQKFGGTRTEGEVLSSLVGEYERLAVDRQFAETTYTAALAAYDVAQAEAQRKSRYLAAYVKPTLAQTAEFPERLRIFIIATSLIMLMWICGVLIYYSVRNRR